MGYISYTTANTSGAQAFSDAMVKINRFNNDLLSNMKIIENSDGTCTYEQKFKAYQFISDFYNHSETGEYNDLVGSSLDALRPLIMEDVETELQSQQASMPADNHGNYTTILYKGQPATALDLITHWNDTTSPFTFSMDFWVANTLDMPWADGHSDNNVVTYTDETGQHTIPGGGLHAIDTVQTSAYPGGLASIFSGSAQALAGFAKTINVNPNPDWDFEEQYKNDLANAGFSTATQNT